MPGFGSFVPVSIFLKLHRMVQQVGVCSCKPTLKFLPFAASIERFSIEFDLGLVFDGDYVLFCPYNSKEICVVHHYIYFQIIHFPYEPCTKFDDFA